MIWSLNAIVVLLSLSAVLGATDCAPFAVALTWLASLLLYGSLLSEVGSRVRRLPYASFALATVLALCLLLIAAGFDGISHLAPSLGRPWTEADPVDLFQMVIWGGAAAALVDLFGRFLWLLHGPAEGEASIMHRFALQSEALLLWSVAVAVALAAPDGTWVLLPGVGTVLGLLTMSVAPSFQSPRFEPGTLRGLWTSFLVYYGIPFRLRRMRRFYRAFIPPKSLVFDVGAHIGSRVRAFRSLECEVVAVEPQSSCLQVLKRLYGHDGGVHIVEGALGAEQGMAELQVSMTHPTMSTLSERWIEGIRQHCGNHIAWDHKERVRMQTLDELIQRFGLPAFVKIDVEGLEAEVLKGLSHPVPAISFEFMPAAPDSAEESVRIVAGLGEYGFNYSIGERMRFVLPEWVSASRMSAILAGMCPGDPSGDVVAVHRPSIRLDRPSPWLLKTLAHRYTDQCPRSAGALHGHGTARTLKLQGDDHGWKVVSG